MAIINRASLPEEFFDVTSALLLKQPEPQYIFSLLFKAAIGSAMMLAASSQLGISPNRAIPDTGLAYTLPGADRLALAAPDAQVNNVILAVAELSTPQIGQTVRINRPRYGSGGFTLAAREIPSGAVISTVPIDVQSEQVTVTLKRYGGPYDPVNGNVAPFALDRFDSSRSVHSIAQVTGTHLQRDFDKWSDTVVAAFLASGTTQILPAGFTSSAASAVQGDMPGDADVLFRAYETLKIANISPFPNGRYRAFITPTFSRQVKNDAQASSFARYDTGGLNPITSPGGMPTNGYLSSFTGCDVYESTTLPTTVNGNSINISTNIMVGPGMMAVGAGQLPYVASSTDDNYGESAKVVWMSYLGFNLADARFGVQILSS